MKLLTLKLFLAISALLSTSLVGLPPTSAGGLPSGYQKAAPKENLVGDSLVEHSSDVVVESAPDTDPSDQKLNQLIGQTRSELAKADRRTTANATVNSPAKQSSLIPAGRAAASGGISVVFDSSSPSPPEVQAVLLAAAAQWDEVLATTPEGPIEVNVAWTSLGSNQLLGYAGPDGMYSGSALPTPDRYPAALTNTLLGIDANGPSRPEIEVVLNSDLEASGRWYIGTSGSPSATQLDLFSVALHEIGHGLGFLGSAKQDSGGDFSLTDTPFRYDREAQYQDVAVPDLQSLDPALTSRNLRVEVNSQETYRLHAPDNWSQGSSYSHFDEGTYTSGEAGALMTPILRNAEVTRTVDAPTLGLMQQIAWPILPRAVTPTITTTGVSSSTATVSWTRDLSQTGLPPANYRIEALLNGTTQTVTMTVAGTSTAATLSGLQPSTDYAIRVTPLGANGSGTPTTASVTTTSTSTSTTTTPVTTTTSPSTTQPTTTTATVPSPADTLAYVRNAALDGQVARLYQAYFARRPYQSGFNYWQGQRARGLSLEAISNAFAASPEFTGRYGSLSDSQFITLVYRNVLGRQPDSNGLSHWRQALASGTSRGSVMIGFAESTEFIRRTRTTAPHSSTEGSIRRLYQASVLRTPDISGMVYWVGQANSGRSLTSIADQFATSPEFAKRYGPLSNTAFVQLIYRNVLGRTADSSGLNFWLGQLNAGKSRGAVMVGFSESSEFVLKTGTIP